METPNQSFEDDSPRSSLSSDNLTRESGFEESLSKDETLRLREAHLASATTLYFKNDPIKIVKGSKQYLYDELGNEYLDCINNVAHVGHCHPTVTAAACQQISQLYTNSRYLHDNLSTYVQRLSQLFPNPLEVCFLTNSGSESNDLALQLARAYTGGTEVITLDGAYHGHLQSCLDISPFKWSKHGTTQKPDHVHVAASPNVYRGMFADSSDPAKDYANEVKRIVDEITTSKKKLSAFIMESMQSCGGQVIPPDGYMAQSFRIAREAGGVCIADEVQVGFGRIGSHYWAFQPQGVVPDIVTIGKPMGNGHPISAVVTTKRIADSYWKIANGYFNTYGGNPVSCAIAHAVLDVIDDENLLSHAKSVGGYLLKGLKNLAEKHEIIGDVRGVGLFIGVEIIKDGKSKSPGREEAAEIYFRMRERYILISVEGPDENVIKLKPPMCFDHTDADRLLQCFDDIMSSMPYGDIITPDPKLTQKLISRRCPSSNLHHNDEKSSSVQTRN